MKFFIRAKVCLAPWAACTIHSHEMIPSVVRSLICAIQHNASSESGGYKPHTRSWPQVTNQMLRKTWKPELMEATALPFALPPSTCRGPYPWRGSTDLGCDLQ